MICTPCAEGADLVCDPPPQITACRNIAVGLHEACPGGTWCDCQHAVPGTDEIAERRANRQRR